MGIKSFRSHFYDWLKGRPTASATESVTDNSPLKTRIDLAYFQEKQSQQEGKNITDIK